MAFYHIGMAIRSFHDLTARTSRLVCCAAFMLTAGFSITLFDGSPALAQSGGAASKGQSVVIQEETSLEELKEKLARQAKPAQAKRTANRIQRKWIESDSDSINVLMRWATEAMKAQNTARASDLLDQVTVIAPDYAAGWNLRATLYFSKKDYGRSLADIEQVLKLEPDHFGALSGLAAILQSLGRDAEALSTWYKVLEVYPANEVAQKQVIELEEKLAGEAT